MDYELFSSLGHVLDPVNRVGVRGPCSPLWLFSAATRVQQQLRPLFSRQWRRWLRLRRREPTAHNNLLLFFFLTRLQFRSPRRRIREAERFQKRRKKTGPWVCASATEGPKSAAKSPLVSGKGAQGRESFPSPPFCDNKEPKNSAKNCMPPGWTQNKKHCRLTLWYYSAYFIFFVLANAKCY